MKFTFSLLLIVLVFSCSSSEVTVEDLESTADYVASEDQKTSEYTPLYIHKIPQEKNLNAKSTLLGGYEKVLVPPMDRLEAQLLTSKYWVVEGYSDGNASRGQRIAGIGQWLRCNPDGTFTAGHWQKQTHAGAWYLHYNYQFPRLVLDSNVDKRDIVWEIQAINGERTEIAVIIPRDGGFGEYRKSMNCKWIALDDIPTKEQFAGILNALN